MNTDTLYVEAGRSQQRGTVSVAASRVALLDVLRGFASLGILVFNIIAFSGWVLLSPKQAAGLPGAALDAPLAQALETLVEGKFYCLFSMLFGVGFALIARGAERKGEGATRILLRRYLALLGIGLCHTILIWFGDILVLYALLGFVLLACRGLSDRVLVRCAVALLLLPIGLYGVALVWCPGGPDLTPIMSKFPGALHAFAAGSYPQIVAGNIVVTEFGWVRRLVLMFIPRVFGMFLLGVALGRMGVFEAPGSARAFLSQDGALGTVGRIAGECGVRGARSARGSVPADRARLGAHGV